MAEVSRVNTPENPFGTMQVLRWNEPSADPTSNAVADPPATSVAVAPVPEVSGEPEVSNVPDGSEDGTEGTTEGAEQQPPSRRPIAPRISELTEQRNAARTAQAQAEGRATALQTELDYWKAQALQGQTGREAPPEAPQPPSDGVPRDAQGMPQYPMEANYATQAEYHQALHAYTMAMIQAGVQHGLAQERQRTAFDAAMADARSKHPNLDQLMAVRVPMNKALEQAIGDSPQWPLVMAYLAEHPTEAQQLLRVDRRGAYAAVDAIEAKLATPAPPAPSPAPSVPEEPPTQSSAPPPPVPPVRGRSVPAPQGYEQMDYMTFYRTRNKEEYETRRSL